MTWATDTSKLKKAVEYWYQLLTDVQTTHLSNLDDYQSEGSNTSFSFAGYVSRASGHRANLSALFETNDDYSFWLSYIAIDSINPGTDSLIEELKKFMAKGTSPSTASIHSVTAGGTSITRGAGDYAADGYVAGDWVYMEDDGYFYRERVTNVAAMTLTIAHGYRGATTTTGTVRRVQTFKSTEVAVTYPTYNSTMGGDKLIVFMKKYDQYDYLIESPKRTQTWTFELVEDLHDDSTYEASGLFEAKSAEGIEKDYISTTGAKEHYGGVFVYYSGNLPNGNIITSNNSFQSSFNTTTGWAGWAKDTADAWADCSKDTDEYLHYTPGTVTKTNISGTGHSCEWITDFTMTYYGLNSKSFNEHFPYIFLMFYSYFDTRAGDATTADGSLTFSAGSLTVYGPVDGILKSNSYYSGNATFAASPSTIITGAGTAFSTEFERGDLIWNAADDKDTYAVEIMDVVSDSEIRLKSPYLGTAGGAAEIGGRNLLSGTVTFAASTAIVGTSTKFLSEISIGDIIWNSADDTIADAKVIASIESDTAATLSAAYASGNYGLKEYSVKCCGWHWLDISDYLEYFWTDNLTVVIDRSGSAAGSVFLDNICVTPYEWYPEIGSFMINMSRAVNLEKGDSYTITTTVTGNSKIQKMLAFEWQTSFPHYTTATVTDP